MADIQNEEEMEVLVVEPDMRLKEKVGGDVRKAWSKQKIDTAQQKLDRGKQEILQRCLSNANQLKELCDGLQENFETKEILETVHKHTMAIKADAGMADYPIATEFADSLFLFLQEVENLDAVSLKIVTSHVDSIVAVFREERKGAMDALAVQTKKELLEISRAYLDMYRAKQAQK